MLFVLDIFVRSLPRRNENYAAHIFLSFQKMSEAYLEGMKTVFACCRKKAKKKSEAYLEGMKTTMCKCFRPTRKLVRSLPRRNENSYVFTILYILHPPSEAYLEGMKTAFRDDRFAPERESEAYLEGMKTSRRTIYRHPPS